ncbi:MAG: TIGR04211 family SH3 domain-containing protein [Desulfobacterales bacterium]|nr:TIGR04211 family SH3 domain-containing protein [Desulfobacterales bacterium]
MKTHVLIAAFLLFMTSQAIGQTLYITDRINATFRSGAGTEFNIIKSLPSGSRVELMEEGDRWSRVITSDGEEGWVLKQWLTPTPTQAILLTRLRTAHENLKSTTDMLKKRAERLSSENTRLKKELAASEQNATNAKEAFTTLKEKSSNFLQLEEDYRETRNQLDNLSKKSDLLNDRLARKNMVWFLAGAGVLLVGYLMGSSSRKKRSSFY